MSVVAVKLYKTKLVIGADSITVRGWTQNKDKQAKLIKLRDGLIVGQVGRSRDVQLLRIFAKDHLIAAPEEDKVVDFVVEFIEWCRKKDNDYKLGSSMVFVVENRAFLIEKDLFIKEVEDYFAIGAGRDFALSALYLGKGVKEAIDSACELSILCEKPVNIMEVEK